MKISVKAISVTNSILKGVTLPEKPDTSKCDEEYSSNGVCHHDEFEFIKECSCKAYQEAYNSALQQGIEFEDQKRVSKLPELKCGFHGINDADCYRENCKSKDGDCPLWTNKYSSDPEDDKPEFIPLKDGIYPLVEPIECEVQRQYRHKSGLDIKSWFMIETSVLNHPISDCEYRTVLVICEVKEVEGLMEQLKEAAPRLTKQREVKEQPVKPEIDIYSEQSKTDHENFSEVSKPEREEQYSITQVKAILKKFAEYIDQDRVESPSIYRKISDQWFDSMHGGLKEDTQTSESQDKLWKEAYGLMMISSGPVSMFVENKFTISRKQ